MSLGVLNIMFCVTRPLLNKVDSKTNFLRTGLSSHCLWDKGRFDPPPKKKRKKKRRLAQAMGQDAHSNVKY